jgi:hypothetical protein
MFLEDILVLYINSLQVKQILFSRRAGDGTQCLAHARYPQHSSFQLVIESMGFVFRLSRLKLHPLLSVCSFFICEIG